MLGGEAEKARVMLGLLESVERNGGQSQRRLAADLGIALGLVNAYLKRCVKKGLVKVREAPARRYAYYLTPQGLAEKSRLTIKYLSYSFNVLRQAKTDFAALLHSMSLRGAKRIVLAGKSDLAEIAALCAFDSGITIVAIVDPEEAGTRLLGVPVFASLQDVGETFDMVVVTDIKSPEKVYRFAVERLGQDRVWVPNLLSVRVLGTKKRAV
jgi:DNA-binding MarR family transcriptional regulator